MRPSVRRALAAFVGVVTLAAGLIASAPANAHTGSIEDAFVTREGAHLELQGRQFRFAGANIYWLGLDENVGGVAYPTYFRIDDALETARIMDATVVRSGSLGDSVGCPLCLEPSLGTFNPNAFATIDYSLAEARKLGLRLVIPLTDNWDYYAGGHVTFTKWLGDASDADFYTDPRVIAAFEDYISHLLNHVDPYTGLALKNDPTIMSWELGNELNGMTVPWVDEISSYIKRLAPNQLISAGSQTGVAPAALASPDVDIVDAHFYPAPAAPIASAAATTVAAGKVFMAGETDSVNSTTDDVLAAADNPDISGQMFWDLLGHNDTGGFVQHSDGYTVHFPGDTTAMHQHVIAYEALGQLMDPQVISQLPSVPSTPPLITTIAKHYGINQVTWRGTDGACTYKIERSNTGPDGPYTTVATGLTDNDTPWTDATTPTTTAWYKVTAYNWNNQSLGISQPTAVAPAQDTVTDPLESWTIASSHSSDINRTPVGDGVIVAPVRGEGGQITWSHAGLSSITADFATRDPRRLPQIRTSTDATTWTTVPAHVRATATGLSLTAKLNGTSVRLDWSTTEDAPATEVHYSYATASPATATPGAFQQTPAAGATNVSAGTALTWTASNQAAYYDLTVSTHQDLSDPLIQETDLQTTSYTPTTTLAPNTTYYYKVTAVNADGTTAADGAPTSFTTASQIVDDFSTYANSAALAAAYVRNTGGDAITPSLDTTTMGTGNSVRLDYTLDSAGYAGVSHTLTSPENWGGATALQLWIKNDGSVGRNLSVQFVANGIYWQTTIDLSGETGSTVGIPMSGFQIPSWAPTGALDLSSVTEISFYLGGTTGSGTVWIGDIIAGK